MTAIVVVVRAHVRTIGGSCKDQIRILECRDCRGLCQADERRIIGMYGGCIGIYGLEGWGIQPS